MSKPDSQKKSLRLSVNYTSSNHLNLGLWSLLETVAKNWSLFGPYFRHLVPIFENKELNEYYILWLILISGGLIVGVVGKGQ